jgi:hypothetical protein
MSTKSVSGNAAPATPAAQAGPATAGQAQAFSAQAAPAASPPPAPAPLSPAQQIGQAGMVGAQGQLQAGGQFLEQMGKVNWGTPGSALNGVRMGGQDVREVVDINVQYMQGRELAFIQRETPIAGDGSVAEAVPHMIGSVVAGALGTLLAAGTGRIDAYQRELASSGSPGRAEQAGNEGYLWGLAETATAVLPAGRAALAAGSIEAARQMRSGETDPGKILATVVGTAALSYGLDKAGDWLMGFITRGPGQGPGNGPGPGTLRAVPAEAQANAPRQNPDTAPARPEPMQMAKERRKRFEQSGRGMALDKAAERVIRQRDLSGIPDELLTREKIATLTAENGDRLDISQADLNHEMSTRVQELAISNLPEADRNTVRDYLRRNESARPTPDVIDMLIRAQTDGGLPNGEVNSRLDLASLRNAQMEALETLSAANPEYGRLRNLRYQPGLGLVSVAAGTASRSAARNMSLRDAITLAGEARDLRGMPDELLANPQDLLSQVRGRFPAYSAKPAEIDLELATRINERAVELLEPPQRMMVEGFLEADDDAPLRPTPGEIDSMFALLDDNAFVRTAFAERGGAIDRGQWRAAQGQAFRELSGRHEIYHNVSDRS